MAAGMHGAGMLTGIGQVGFLLHRQRVEIGAKADGAIAAAGAKGGDDAGLAEAARDLKTPFFELSSNEIRSLELGKPDLRHLVQPVPDLDKLRQEILEIDVAHFSPHPIRRN
ncbi:hypothetical protein RHSP_38657 [Rhizobium freirei PRF 81]|uniref:Uncharacterized protein n=1 Tax=Rhizobium freirei PRF 81 TaxID=363754 RepID=N6V4Q6_9HYPH|nr:hypothetical protein RHSP_38657 [Rhizobium freirei PRF 81]